MCKVVSVQFVPLIHAMYYNLYLLVGIRSCCLAAIAYKLGKETYVASEVQILQLIFFVLFLENGVPFVFGSN